MRHTRQHEQRRHDRADGASAPASGSPRVHAGSGLPDPADDADLDGQYGNPTVHRDPPRWTGQSYAGVPFGDCPSDYLRDLAGFLAWKAREAEKKNEVTKNGKPRHTFILNDAARALGWALRNERKARPGGRPGASGVTGRGSMADVGADVDEGMPF